MTIYRAFIIHQRVEDLLRTINTTSGCRSIKSPSVWNGHNLDDFQSTTIAPNETAEALIKMQEKSLV